MSRQYNIALIPGDGIGPEVIREAVRVLKHIEKRDDRFSFAFREFPWGCDFFQRTVEQTDTEIGHSDLVRIGETEGKAHINRVFILYGLSPFSARITRGLLYFF